MTQTAIRVLAFCFIPTGFFLLLQGIKWIRKAIGGAVLLNIPLMQTEAQFSVVKEGSYAIWQKGKRLQKTAIKMPVPFIYNEATGQSLWLHYPIAVVTSNDGRHGRIRLLTFYASAGQYRYKLSADITAQNEWLEKMRASRKDVSSYALEIQESRPVAWLGLGILVLILAAFFIISGLVFTLNPHAIPF